MPDLYAPLPRFADLKVLVIGDIILDHFLQGAATRISPEAPVPVVKVLEEEYRLGGSANVLNNIVALGGHAEICGMIGRDHNAERVLRRLARLGDMGEGILRTERRTTLKTRVLAQGQQIVRIDREETASLPEAAQRQFADFLATNLARFDAVLVSDYAKGMVGESSMQSLRHALEQARRETGKPLPWVVDPKPANMPHFAGSTIVTPNHHEAARMSGLPIRGEENLLAAAHVIQGELSAEAVLITRGAGGMALLERDEPIRLIPTVAKEVFDVTGAGDTVAATLALVLAAGASMFDAALIANHAAGIVVGKAGTATVSVPELLAVLPKN